MHRYGKKKEGTEERRKRKAKETEENYIKMTYINYSFEQFLSACRQAADNKTRGVRILNLCELES